MIDNSLKTLHFINYLLIAFIVAAVLILTRNILILSLPAKTGHFLTSSHTAPTMTALKKKGLMDYADILKKNPFGPSMELHALAVSRETPSEQGTLSDLVLIGTVTGSKDMTYGIFKDNAGASSGKEEIFALGEAVFNYGTLKKVDTTSVEIERDSIIHKLNIPFENSVTSNVLSRNRSADTSKNAFARKVGERQYILDSDKVQQSIENPEHIMTDARLLPNFVDGKQEGFSISEVIPDGLYDNLGLQNGDILLKVNGLEMSNPEVAIQAMTALRGMNRVNLDISRGGQNMSMSYQLR